MLKRDMADELYSIVIKRYQEEKPEVKLTSADMDRIWYSVYGELQRNGKEAVYECVKTAPLSTFSRE